MIRVLRHGNTISVQNPVTGEWQNMINVTFIEEGRGGADKGMTETTAFLSSVTGEEVGLNQVRIHTHPVLADKIGHFPIDTEFPGHINRGLFSQPQIRQQVDKDPRIVDGKPTYFKTWISNKPEEDVDMRMDNNVLASMKPSAVFGSNVQAANVRVLESAQQKGFVSNPYGYNPGARVSGAVSAPADNFTQGTQNFGNATENTPNPGVTQGTSADTGRGGGTDVDQRSETQRSFPK